jgi:branched-chain amino acid transport system permease protein
VPAEESRTLQARAFLAGRDRWRAGEALPWALAVAAFFAFPDSVYVGTQVLILVLFALSLDLVLGYAGIVTLGHAAFFGIGAYAAGGLVVHLGWHEPLSGLLFGGLCAALAGAVSGPLLLRYHGLALLMLTLAMGILLQESGNAWESFTGGYDGMNGITPSPLLGRFDNDLYGYHYYWYALAVLGAVFLLCRRVVHSAFGASLVGIRENAERMPAIGCAMLGRKVAVWTLSAFIAGLAGALFAQSNAYVTLQVFSFARSGAVLIVLVLGGTGRLYGAFLGGTIYYLLENNLAKLSPTLWEFGVGLALLVVVSFGHNGLLGLYELMQRRLRRA